MGKKEAAKKAKRAAEAAAAAAKSAAAKSAAAKSAAAAEAGGGAAAAAEPATGLRLAQEIAGLAVEPEPETREKMLVRHKKELRDLAVKCRKKLKKGTIDQGDANVLEDEMLERHTAELALLPPAPDDAGGEGDDAVEEGAPAEEDEGERKRRKAREKAARKAARQREAAAEREARIKAEMASAGPLPRDVENSVIQRRLEQFGEWRVKEIPSDGHCMFRAVADQLAAQGRLGDFGLPAVGAHTQLRRRAAQHMLANAANFEPFCTADDFGAYCRDVEATAQWGSQMELQALCHSLRTEIWVHSAESDTIKMGTEYADGSARALQVTFHLHYYAMGEHYNSVTTGASE